jgi:hypothetical protein
MIWVGAHGEDTHPWLFHRTRAHGGRGLLARDGEEPGRTRSSASRRSLASPSAASCAAAKTFRKSASGLTPILTPGSIAPVISPTITTVGALARYRRAVRWETSGGAVPSTILKRVGRPRAKYQRSVR